MTESDYNSGNEKLEFRELVLAHLKRILEISSHELRNTSREVIGSGLIHKIEEEDTRYSYLQSIENLAYILMPYFDDTMKKIYDESIQIMDSWNFEIKELLKEDYKKISESVGEEKLKESFAMKMKLKYAKKLFIGLNMLLNRNDYLKTSVYGEDSDNEEIIEEGGEEENENK